MTYLRVILVIAVAVVTALASEEVPESIRNGEWDLRISEGVKYHVVSPQDATKRIPFPDAIWNEAGRHVTRPHADFASAQKMFKEGMWTSFVRQSVTSIEDVIIGEYAAIPGYEVCTELEPVPAPAQLDFCKRIASQWLAPVHEAFVPRSKASAYVSPWNRIWFNNARIRALQGTVPKQGSGGSAETVYWYDHPMTSEDMLIEIAGPVHRLDFRREFGHTIAASKSSDPLKTLAAWPSGQFLISLELPKPYFREMIKPYLEKYPPTWGDKIDYDAARLMLKVLDEAIPEMTKHLDDPLEYLRYSFKNYPFDLACQRAWTILPENTLGSQHDEAVKAINEKWLQTPADKIKLSDYHDAMLAHRREVVAKIVAERDRIAKHGLDGE